MKLLEANPSPLGIDKTAYAIYDTKNAGFVYLDLGDAKYSPLPKKSGISPDKNGAEKIKQRFISLFTEKLRMNKDALKNNPRYPSIYTREIKNMQSYLNDSKNWIIVEISVRRV